MPGKVPDRWEDYSSLGKVISGTRFVAFKVPLDEGFTPKLSSADLAFVPNDLLAQLKEGDCQLGLVIDLTNTKRYYNPKHSLFMNNVEYKKILTEGHVVPSLDVQEKFANTVKTFLKRNNRNNNVIGVHCTHGVNRTGYLICRYMISEMGMEPDKAIKAFNECRGHDIERENYVQDLKSSTSKQRSQTRPDQASRQQKPKRTYPPPRDNRRSDARNDGWRRNGHQNQHHHHQQWNQHSQGYQDYGNYRQDDPYYWQDDRYYAHHDNGYAQPQGRHNFHQGHHSSSDNWWGHESDGQRSRRHTNAHPRR